MFGIGLPEMIVILAVALIVVGPDKLPDMARSLAKGMFELKKTVNQVKASLEDEDNVIGSVQSDLKKTAEDLKGDLLDSDHFTWKEPEGGTPSLAAYEKSSENGAVIDMDDLKPLDKKTEGEVSSSDDQDSHAEGQSSGDDTPSTT